MFFISFHACDHKEVEDWIHVFIETYWLISKGKAMFGQMLIKVERVFEWTLNLITTYLQFNVKAITNGRVIHNL